MSHVNPMMSHNDERTHLSNEQKTRLLHVALGEGASTPSIDADEQRGDLLCDILRCPLPAETGTGPSTADAHDPTSRYVFGPPVGEMLCDPETGVTVLEHIKEYAKALGKTSASNLEKDVFLALYFAAIASALVFHGQRITEHSSTDLSLFLESFARAPWVPVNLMHVLASATDICAQRKPGDARGSGGT